MGRVEEVENPGHERGALLVNRNGRGEGQSALHRNVRGRDMDNIRRGWSRGNREETKTKAAWLTGERFKLAGSGAV